MERLNSSCEDFLRRICSLCDDDFKNNNCHSNLESYRFGKPDHLHANYFPDLSEENCAFLYKALYEAGLIRPSFDINNEPDNTYLTKEGISYIKKYL